MTRRLFSSAEIISALLRAGFVQAKVQGQRRHVCEETARREARCRRGRPQSQGDPQRHPRQYSAAGSHDPRGVLGLCQKSREAFVEPTRQRAGELFPRSLLFPMAANPKLGRFTPTRVGKTNTFLRDCQMQRGESGPGLEIPV